MKKVSQGKADVVVSGQLFYESQFRSEKEIVDLICAAYEGNFCIKLSELVEKCVKRIKGNIFSLDDLAPIIKGIKPETMIFRYSVEPSSSTEFLTGEIAKNGDFLSVADFLNSQMLGYYFSSRDFVSMKNRFPKIKVYEIPIDLSHDNFVLGS